MLSEKERAGDGGPYREPSNAAPTCGHPGWESGRHPGPSGILHEVPLVVLRVRIRGRLVTCTEPGNRTEGHNPHPPCSFLPGTVASNSEENSRWAAQVFIRETRKNASLLLLSLLLQRGLRAVGELRSLPRALAGCPGSPGSWIKRYGGQRRPLWTFKATDISSGSRAFVNEFINALLESTLFHLLIRTIFAQTYNCWTELGKERQVLPGEVASYQFQCFPITRTLVISLGPGLWEGCWEASVYVDESGLNLEEAGNYYVYLWEPDRYMIQVDLMCYKRDQWGQGQIADCMPHLEGETAA